MWIELTDSKDGVKFMVNTDKIGFVIPDGTGCTITGDESEDGDLLVNESYEEMKEKLL